MNVNIEFFDREPIENLITCLHFKMDKVIYFGYSDVMTSKRQDSAKHYLKKLCGIEQVDFHVVSQRNLQSIVERLKEVLEQERQAGNQCFFDVTGGEDLILVAMGILAKGHEIPLHLFDMDSEEVRMLNKWEMPGIADLAEKRKITLTLDDIIGFRGGKIIYRKQKEYKNKLRNPEFEALVQKMWDVAKQDQEQWNAMSSILKECTRYEDESHLHVAVERKKLEGIVGKRREFGSLRKFLDYLEPLQYVGIIKNVVENRDKLCYSYRDETLRDCLLDAGSLLELRTYYKRLNSGKYCDCRVGVHIDWDGEYMGPGMDVENEIDVMLLEGYVPVFISCKNGKVDQMALYELHTVAKRFGGKYVKKELVAGQYISTGYRSRAEEMDILISKEG